MSLENIRRRAGIAGNRDTKDRLLTCLPRSPTAEGLADAGELLDAGSVVSLAIVVRRRDEPGRPGTGRDQIAR